MVTKRAGKLFIYAFTALNYIEEKRPVERLLGMMELDFAPGQPLTEPLDEMYSLVLTNALNPASHTPDEIERTKQLLAIILVLRESLSVAALGDLIGAPAHYLKSCMQSYIHRPIAVSGRIAGAVFSGRKMSQPSRTALRVAFKISQLSRPVDDAREGMGLGSSSRGRNLERLGSLSLSSDDA
ncbi:hypothetical protein CERSUDRAFT_100103 [Gelatoporia subvermispora B]|uniref:Uncharacterized protein n=1 Tax=Ceriporiopsis subvermispora (strain B) TaxID=914234 RepID=M2Q4B0_CERS8|nr:hypothetical protein CERSUDRAFT_100103 [Gelatoporia subvermispora B]